MPAATHDPTGIAQSNLFVQCRFARSLRLIILTNRRYLTFPRSIRHLRKILHLWRNFCRCKRLVSAHLRVPSAEIFRVEFSWSVLRVGITASGAFPDQLRLVAGGPVSISLPRICVWVMVCNIPAVAYDDSLADFLQCRSAVPPYSTFGQESWRNKETLYGPRKPA